MRGQYSVLGFLNSTTCGLLDGSCDNYVTKEVWNKLTNVLILASLTEHASGIRPLITPLTKVHFKHPR